jgi:AcrR family transcriptional regulator
VKPARRILDGATQAFYEKGFHGVGVDELGRRAGLAGPSIYRHFSSKDEILATLLNEALDELLAATRPQVADPLEDLTRALTHHLDFTIGNRQLVLIYQRDHSAMVDPWRTDFARRRAGYVAQWRTLVEASYPELERQESETVVQACLGTIFAIASWHSAATPGDQVRETVLGLVTNGLTSLNGSR